MKTFSTILQGSEAVESLAREFVQGFDFSEDETEDSSTHTSDYIDTVNGIQIYYNWKADYYFFTAEYLNA